jgi:hypothetical protein
VLRQGRRERLSPEPPAQLLSQNILSWPDYRDQVLIPFQLKRYDALGLWYWSKNNPDLLKNLEDARKTLK